MIANKHVTAFTKRINWHELEPVTDSKTAKARNAELNNALLDFHHSLSDALVMLSTEQQSRLLLQILKNFRAMHFYYNDPTDYTTPEQVAHFNRKWKIYHSVEGNYPKKGIDRKLNEQEGADYLDQAISICFYFAQSAILIAYKEIEGEEKSLRYILNRRERVEATTKWHDAKLASQGMPADTRTYEEKLEEIILEQIEHGPNYFPADNSGTLPLLTEQASTTLPWLLGINDFADLLYKLQLKGSIDLQAYFNAGGKGTELSRAFCRIFSFNTEKGKAASTLNNYLSDIKKTLGEKKPNELVLKAMGKSRNWNLDD